MANIQEKIAKLCPEATFEEGQDLLVCVPDSKWHALAKSLKEELHFDFLVTIVGMDWTDKLGCIYYLKSTADNEMISVKVTTDNRENPMIHSVHDVWKIATTFEREVYDFFGIIFVNNPDMRRMFLSIDWKGYPLRKDYDDSPEINPVPKENERQEDTTVSYVETEDGKIEKKTINVFEPNDFVVNIGPQHPATHGVLRFRTAVDGETIKKIDFYSGYIHRGIEKICEGLTYPQTLHFMDRMDYFSGHHYHHAMCMVYEKALGIEISRRAQVIRVLMDELARIASHCLFLGTYCMDLGATTMLFYTLRVREQILDIMEKTCGARMTFNYGCIGGVMQDLHEDFVSDVKELLAVLPKNIKEYNELFIGNVIAKGRLINVGTLSREDAISYAVTGPSGRASGWACDVRKRIPYALYDKVEFDEVLRTEGDIYARYMVRMDEILQSIRIIEQLVDNIPEGPVSEKMKPIIKLPEGHWFRQVEASRGAFGVYIESRGDKYPYRLKFNSPGMMLVASLDEVCRGGKIADLIAGGGSLDYVIPDIDR